MCPIPSHLLRPGNSIVAPNKKQIELVIIFGDRKPQFGDKPKDLASCHRPRVKDCTRFRVACSAHRVRFERIQTLTCAPIAPTRVGPAEPSGVGTNCPAGTRPGLGSGEQAAEISSTRDFCTSAGFALLDRARGRRVRTGSSASPPVISTRPDAIGSSGQHHPSSLRVRTSHLLHPRRLSWPRANPMLRLDPSRRSTQLDPRGMVQSGGTCPPFFAGPARPRPRPRPRSPGRQTLVATLTQRTSSSWSWDPASFSMLVRSAHTLVDLQYITSMASADQ